MSRTLMARTRSRRRSRSTAGSSRTVRQLTAARLARLLENSDALQVQRSAVSDAQTDPGGEHGRERSGPLVESLFADGNLLPATPVDTDLDREGNGAFGAATSAILDLHAGDQLVPVEIELDPWIAVAFPGMEEPAVLLGASASLPRGSAAAKASVRGAQVPVGPLREVSGPGLPEKDRAERQARKEHDRASSQRALPHDALVAAALVGKATQQRRREPLHLTAGHTQLRLG